MIKQEELDQLRADIESLNQRTRELEILCGQLEKRFPVEPLMVGLGGPSLPQPTAPHIYVDKGI